MRINNITMKRLRFLPVLLVLIMTSCVKNQFDEVRPGTDEVGLVTLALEVDDRVQIVPVKGLDESLVPPADSLYVELYRFAKRKETSKKETWNRVYFGRYEEARDSVFKVVAGQWKMIAFHGDSTACGFDKPYFLAEEDFDVTGGLNAAGRPAETRVSATAKVSNVRLTVDFDRTVSGSYYDYFVRFTNLDQVKQKQILRCWKGEKRDAYMMASDSVKIEFMAQTEFGDDSSWRFVVLDTIATKPNDHYTLSISANPRYGSLNVNITTDDNLVEKNFDMEIQEAWAPQDPPQLVAAGFPNGDHAIVEGDVNGNGATISAVARAGLEHFYLKIDSDYLTGIPLGEEIDIADPELDPDTKAALVSIGLKWQEFMYGSRRLTYLTMTDLFANVNEKLTSLSGDREVASFSIRVVDNVGHETSLNLTATAYAIYQELSVDEGDVWATKIVSPKLSVSAGVSGLFTLQVSPDGRSWSDCCGYVSADKGVLDFGTQDASPNTEYYFRTMYNGNPDLVSNTVRVVTEEELQVGNPGFEEYHTTEMHVSPLGWIYDYKREWYLPYNEGDTDPWWAVNSKKTMPDGHTAWTSNYCKNFPCTAYSTDRYEGERSALVYTVNVGNANTDGTAVGTSVPGEIWIGKADTEGNHVTDGRAFSSRPISLKFWYRYAPINNENFVVTMSVKDADGKEIGRSEKLDGPAASEWTQCQMPILYSDTKSKAASIYISFKSSGSPSVNTAVTMEIAGKQQTAHIGSALRIDNIELTY